MAETQGSLDIVVRVLEQVVALRKREAALQASPQGYTFADREKMIAAYTRLFEENREALTGTPEALYLPQLVSAESILDRTIESYYPKLSGATTNALFNLNIVYVGELAQKTETELTRKTTVSINKGLGPKRVEEIRDVVLKPLGLSFGMRLNYKRPEER